MLKVRLSVPFWYRIRDTEGMTGKETRGYDPSQDIVWLRSEIVRWVQGNLMEKWYFLVPLLTISPFNVVYRGSIKRRHQATSMYTPAPTICSF